MCLGGSLFPSLPDSAHLPTAMTVAAVPPVLSAVGFTGSGIAASSLAAKMMSLSAIANGGGVPAGGLVAILQSAGKCHGRRLRGKARYRQGSHFLLYLFSGFYQRKGGWLASLPGVQTSTSGLAFFAAEGTIIQPGFTLEFVHGVSPAKVWEIGGKVWGSCASDQLE